MKFRHEWKHEISYGNYLVLRSRLSAVMQHDRHGIHGSYEIRSLYFDNVADQALQEKINGVDGREKFRLRCYNLDPSYLLLEKKCKYRGLCQKKQEVVTPDEVQILLNGDVGSLPQTKKPLLQELYDKRKSQGLRAKTIVEYTREAFVYLPGNVRITLDHHLRTGLFDTGFMNPESITIPVGGSPIILEVKWDEFLPTVIREVIQISGTHTSAFSKYAACRIYG